ncbi:MAG: NAD(P)/FAD-dependent oxidoreductase [Actinomycetota bacterium]|nr:NAD(P)/FAD-dependent oxidoreductase [Actinomycetota bacterium]
MGGRRVVVIGSGPGGAAAAALMAHAGHRVTLLERNPFFGGKCSSLPRHGCVVDTGVHMFGRGPFGPFGEIGRILGSGPEWVARRPSFTLSLSGGGKLEMASSVLDPLSAFNFARGHLSGWQKMGWLSTSARSLHRLGPGGLLRLARRFHDPRFPLYRELQGVTVADFLSPLSVSPDFLRTFHAQAMLTMVLPWHRASMGEFAYILASTMRAAYLCYPRGGAGAIPAACLHALERLGGEARRGCAAADILVEGGRARGVTTSEGEFIPADLVISNAGLANTVGLAGREHFPREYLERADSARDSEAFIAVKFFLEGRMRSMRTPCLLHLPDLDPFRMFDYLEDGKDPQDLFLFVTAPAAWDESLAAPGRDVLLVGTPAPSALAGRERCDAILDLAQEIARSLFPEIDACADRVERVTTPAIAALSGRRGGDCIGLAQEVEQDVSLRPSQITPVQGLYLVGSDAGGRGIGTEMAADSALRLYYLLKDA